MRPVVQFTDDRLVPDAFVRILYILPGRTALSKGLVDCSAPVSICLELFNLISSSSKALFSKSVKIQKFDNFKYEQH